MKSPTNIFLHYRLSSFSVIILSIVVLFFISCTGEEDELTLDGKYKMSDLAGNWTATQALFSSLDQDYKGSVDVIDEGGSLTMSIQSDGKFTITILIPGESNEVFRGLLRFEEEWLTVSYDTEPDDYDYFFIELSVDKSILTLRGEGAYDFDDDGKEDLSSINLILERN
jgi:hypothetical protein